MYQVGDIVEIVPTEDDSISQHIQGSVARIIKREKYLIDDIEAYELQFIDFKGEFYKDATQHWQPKNLIVHCANPIKENNITDEDIMRLFGDD